MLAQQITVKLLAAHDPFSSELHDPCLNYNPRTPSLAEVSASGPGSRHKCIRDHPEDAFVTEGRTLSGARRGDSRS
jgi:hypothetical protein